MGDSDTIFALATPPGRSAVAVFRISGPRAGEILAGVTMAPLPAPRSYRLRELCDPGSGDKIDLALVSFFRGPHSFTGEDCVELSVHGGRGVISAIAGILSRSGYVRPAEPGEFTRRAFLNGKLDLVQVEAIADLIDSETEFQRRQALRALEGGLGRRLAAWTARLLDVAVELESNLDFSDEADVQDAGTAALAANCVELVREMQQQLDVSSGTMLLREGFTVVIAGPPNVGKSSIFNALVGTDAAIVTDVAGTTRDLIARSLDIEGAPVMLIDSAGLRDTSDPVERIGVERARTAAGIADLAIWLNSPDVPAAPPPDLGVPILQVWSKSDLATTDRGGMQVSVHRPETVEALRRELRVRTVSVAGDGTQGDLIRERHKSALRDCITHLESLRLNAEGLSLELAAEDCREARACLGRIVGEEAPEKLLDEIFGRFCIGK